MTRLEFLHNADALADKYSNEHLSFKIEQGDPFTIERGYLIINVYVNNLYTEFISTIMHLIFKVCFLFFTETFNILFI